MRTETMNAKLTDSEAIDAFTAARKEGEGVRVWSQHRVAKPIGETDWGTEEWVQELLQERVEADFGYSAGTWDEAEWDGKTLELSCNSGWRYSLWCKATPDAGRPRVAYLGAHAGFCWEDDAARSEALKTLLEALRWDDETLAEFGLACCEDYDCGDDGGYWLVADAEKLGAVAAKCQDLDRDWEDLDAEDVLAYLRDGMLPEVE